MEKSLTFRSTLPHFQAMIQRLPLYMYQSCNEDSTKIYVEVSATDQLKGAEANLYTFKYLLFSESIQICFRTLYM